MKELMLFVILMTATTVVAVERQQLLLLIESAATNRESAYVETRNKIVEYGAGALPLLDAIAVDESLPWQQQLAARICKERIERKKDIADLLATDWYSHPSRDPNWIVPIVGEEGLILVNIIKPTLKELGLWNYYLEVEWKTTGELGKIRDRRHDSYYWTRVCTDVVKDSPERIWFLRVCADLIATTPPSSRLHKLYNELLYEEKPDTAEVLEKYNAKFPPPPPRPHPPAPPPDPALQPVPVDYGTNPDGSKKLPPGLSRNPPANN